MKGVVSKPVKQAVFFLFYQQNPSAYRKIKQKNKGTTVSSAFKSYETIKS
ncbi:hypothetical protein MKC73_11325 [[Clostridium] innocuum]|nr:hypothetical protein [[Clostridium] innocuum]MCR0623368.1 hypothetical protein [[Clostridium] innocuum]